MTQEVKLEDQILEGSQKILPGFEKLRMENNQLTFSGNLGREIGAVPVEILEAILGQEITVYIRP